MTFWFPQYKVMTQTAMVSGLWDTRYPIKRCFWTCLGGGFHGRLAFADCPPDAASRGQSKQGETGRLCSAWLRARPGCPVLPGPRPLGPDRRLHPGLSLPGLRTPPSSPGLQVLDSSSWTSSISRVTRADTLLAQNWLSNMIWFKDVTDAPSISKGSSQTWANLQTQSPWNAGGAGLPRGRTLTHGWKVILSIFLPAFSKGTCGLLPGKLYLGERK